MKTLCGMAVVAITLICTPVSVTGTDGNDVLKSCTIALHAKDSRASDKRVSLNTFDYGYCLGMVEAIHTTNTLGQISGPPGLFCLPGQVPYVQLMRVIVTYLKANPKLLHEDGMMLAVVALATAFPCTR